MSSNNKNFELLTVDSPIVVKMSNDIQETKSLLEEYVNALRPKKWVTKHVVMDKLSISERTLAKYRDEGIIPYHQVRGSIRYMESEIEEMMEKFKVPAKRSTGD